MFDYGRRRLLVDDFARTRVKVPLVLRAKHLAELGPRLERGETCMRRDEAMTVPDECQKLFLLLGVDIHFTVAKKENAVDIAQTGTAAGRRAVGFECGVGHDV